MLASTEPSFFTTDKFGGKFVAEEQKSLLQRSRRSSRRTSSASRRGSSPGIIASTEPSFFTTDKSCSQRDRHRRRRHASTEPSFFTTDKLDVSFARARGALLQRSRRSSRRTSEMLAALPLVSDWLQRSRRSSRRTRWRSTRPRSSTCSCFNGAVVLHDGQATGCAPESARTVSLQRSRRSSRRTSYTGDAPTLITRVLQRSRRSSRRTSARG